MFKGIKFPELKKYKPILMFWVGEIYSDKIPRLHSREPIIAGEKRAISVEYKKMVSADNTEVHNHLSSWFPPELEKLEILLEYFNEDDERFYCLFKRDKKGELTNQLLFNKPFRYTWLGSLF